MAFILNKRSIFVAYFQIFALTVVGYYTLKLLEIMTEQEYEIIDELYFVQTFANLAKQLPHYDTQALKAILSQLWAKGWIKCLNATTKQPIEEQEVDLEKNYQSYAYLATKNGLLAHNSK